MNNKPDARARLLSLSEHLGGDQLLLEIVNGMSSQEAEEMRDHIARHWDIDQDDEDEDEEE